MLLLLVILGYAKIGVATIPPHTVNILLFYEDATALRGFNAAIDFVRKKSLNVTIGAIESIQSNGSDVNRLVESLCRQISEYYKRENRANLDLVIDLTRARDASEAPKTISAIMNLPTVSGSFGQDGDIRTWRKLSDNMKGYLIQVAPPADIVPQAMRSIVAFQDMTSGALLFDGEYEMYHKYKSLLQNLPCRHLLTKVETTTTGIRRQIDRLVHVDITNFFIAAKPNEISGVLAEASDPEVRDGPYFSDEYAWYSMSMEPGFPKCSGCRSNVSLIHLSPKFPTSSSKSLQFLQSNGHLKRPHLMDYFYFDLTLTAILTYRDMKINGTWKSPPDWEENRCNIRTSPDENYLFDMWSSFNTASSSAYSLLGRFKTNPSKNEVGQNHVDITMEIHRMLFREFKQDPESSTLIGIWKSGLSEEKLIKDHEEFKDHWKAHVTLTVFRVVTVVQPPFVYKIPGCQESKENKYSRCFEGYCIDLLNRIQLDLGFNYTIRNVSTYGYMSTSEPHDWDGMVRELKDRKADIALGAMSVMAERESVVDYTVPYYDLVGISILMRKPKVETSLFKFLTVLTNDVWMCILAAYFFTSILMWIFDRWSPFSYHNNKEKYEDYGELREFNLKECLWFCMTSLTPQGGGEAPTNLSGRFVAATWWLFGFIVIASYTANLAAFLTVNRLESPIESMDDLARQYKVQYAPIRGSSAWVYFSRMHKIEQRFYQIWKDMNLNETMKEHDQAMISVWDYPVSEKFTKIWDSIQENDPPRSFEAAVQRVMGKDPLWKDEFAFLGDATDMRYEALINCELQVVGEEFSRKPYAIGVQQGSPLKDLLNDSILKLLNLRYLETLKERWWTENPRRAKCPKEEAQHDGISIHNIGGVFIVIFIGIILACVTLLFEYWWNRNKSDISEDIAEIAVEPEKIQNTESTEIKSLEKRNPKKLQNIPTTINNFW